MANEQKPKHSKESGKNKLSETFENLKQNQNIEGLISYAKKNTQDTIAYILLILGIVWMLVHPFYGGILVGLVSGCYFSKEIIAFIKGYNTFFEKQGLPRTLVFGGTVLAFFVMAPGIFIGAMIMVGLKFILKVD